MSRCHTCGKTEPGQAVCLTCGKTYCEEHIDRRCHHCFADPGSREEMRMAETYSRDSFDGTPTYYKDDGFDERSAEIIRNKKKMEKPGLLKTLFSSPTLCIVILCILVFGITQLSALYSNELYYRLYAGLACWPDFILQRPWSLITYMFCHRDLVHLAVNMLTFYGFGLYLEKRIGKVPFLLIYFASGIISAIGFSLFSSNPVIGASGAVMGILAATAVINPDIKVLLYFIIPLKIKYVVVLFAALDLILNFATPNDSIAHIAHLSGILVGIIAGYICMKREKNRTRNTQWQR